MFQSQILKTLDQKEQLMNRKIATKLEILFFLILYIFSPLLSTAVVAQSPAPLKSETRQKVEEWAEKIFEGKKIPLNETISNSEDAVENRYVVFVKKEASSEVFRKFPNSINDKVTFGEAAAVTVQFEGDSSEELRELENDSNVIAITPVVKREVSAYPNPPNDPLFPPSNNYSSSYQWYLNRPSGGNYGIDLLRAWEYLDDEGVNYGGEDEILVAVIDSGVAYEDYTKYSDEWEFGKASDLTDNIYVNSGETAGNDLDDDNNGDVDLNYGVSSLLPYCIDLNDNGNCDLPLEATKSYFDDRNSFNTVDFERYWSVTPSNVSTSPNCGNLPSYKCVAVEDMQCELGNIPRDFGCTPGDMGHANDTMGHGTFVSNIIAAKADNATSGVGIAPGVSILPIQIFSAKYDGSGANWSVDGGYSDQIARAINYAVDAGADVINMSFGGSSPDVYEELALNSAYYDNDVVLVAASGNKGNTQVQYPAGYDSVIAVGATNKDGGKVSYSSYGSHIELSAPVSIGSNSVLSQSYTCYLTSAMWDSDGSGEACMASDTIVGMNPSSGSYPPSILTSFANGKSAGTSFASPQVAAVAALVRSIHPDWDAEQIRYVLKMSASSIGNNGYSQSIGYGVLNAYNAVRGLNADGKSLTIRKRIFQTRRGADNYAYIRQSDDHGLTWGDWIQSGRSYASISIIEGTTSGKVIQAKRGKDYNVWTRYSSNFGEDWSEWSKNGYTSGKVEMVSTGTRIIQSMRGHNSGRIHTRYSSNNGATWSKWDSGIKVTSDVEMIYAENVSRVVQAVRSEDGSALVRRSSDGGTTWSGWSDLGNTAQEIGMVYAGGRVILSMEGKNSGRLHTRYSSNGGNSWNSWQNDILVNGKPEMAYTGSRIIQATRNSKDQNISRYSSDLGQTWSSWSQNGTSLEEINMTYDEIFSKIFQTIRGKKNSSSYIRYSESNGASWSSWAQDASTSDAVEILDITTATWD